MVFQGPSTEKALTALEGLGWCKMSDHSFSSSDASPPELPLVIFDPQSDGTKVSYLSLSPPQNHSKHTLVSKTWFGNTVLSKTPRAHSLYDQIIRYKPFYTKILELPFLRINPGPGPKDQNEVSGTFYPGNGWCQSYRTVPGPL